MGRFSVPPDLNPRRYRGHLLVLVSVCNERGQLTGRNLLFCEHCKCYFHKAASKLTGFCSGKIQTGASGQASRLRRGFFPSEDPKDARWTITAPRIPSPQDALRCLDQLEAARGPWADGTLGPKKPKRRRQPSQAALALQGLDATRAELSNEPGVSAAVAPAPAALNKRRDFFEAFGSSAESSAVLDARLAAQAKSAWTEAAQDNGEGGLHDAGPLGSDDSAFDC